jgi:thiamine pyrophosphate-dependent acetolactate synthase large subunit-like protein
MTQLEIKTNFHKLIDEIEDQKQLSRLYDYMLIIKQNIENTNEEWWDELTEAQKADIDLSIKESEDERNLIPHEQVMEEAKKWLKK